ncbi:hypothetical protein [Pelagibius sp. 7325]|uniref:hypothetical protein n=1 Tax=Pelagibius sp. 7325 TaxID=3131994 RepID=UPI0030ED2762
MTPAVSAAPAALSPLRGRRRLLRLLVRSCFVIPAVAVTACGARKDLPEERRTRGKFGQGKP